MKCFVYTCAITFRISPHVQHPSLRLMLVTLDSWLQFIMELTQDFRTNNNSTYINGFIKQGASFEPPTLPSFSYEGGFSNLKTCSSQICALHEFKLYNTLIMRSRLRVDTIIDMILWWHYNTLWWFKHFVTMSSQHHVKYDDINTKCWTHY